MSATTREQRALEAKVSDVFRSFASAGYRNRAFLSELWREEHLDYLLKGMTRLPASFTVLDSSRPWLCYWIVHSMALLGRQLDPALQADTIEFLKHCKDPLGGYGGGPGQIAHLATTYAAVGTLVSIGGAQALSSIDREKILEFLLRMKDPSSGGFRLHDGGEMDVRGCYTAISVAYLLNILVPPLLEKLGEYVASCQTYEGGIGGEPGAEAHGGYTYCGLAALIMADQVDSLDLPGLLNWAAFRQGKVEGGFQGRTNKLVDGCYSFWQGGVFPLLQQVVTKLISQQTSGSSIMHEEIEDDSDTEIGGIMPADIETFTAEKLFPVRKARNQQHRPFHNPTALQGYILLCCQVLNGGLIDKPGKSKDYYHTCYCLSGLSTAQHCLSTNPEDHPPSGHVFGPYSNLLDSTHPLLNFHMKRYMEAVDYFVSKA
ncbi:protein farnesyltransferase subunit beta [Selaginella moellendorffii]|uniref:protein farnesyltransferase subunit beta n=1 Tax=Selaginella moellendorffii TaxID=88036 RepID=UPI000D1CC669|nr:protein farnesyltransferase subunit beta [Selaginella moellendorffii]|eukprot:XP_024541487.1 protein farnesyltransferase subunit beta [Selaginella moellendorffii]